MDENGYAQPPQYAPPIVINNSASAAAAATVGGRGRQSLLVHLVLFFLTGGIGNIIYWLAKR